MARQPGGAGSGGGPAAEGQAWLDCSRTGGSGSTLIETSATAKRCMLCMLRAEPQHRTSSPCSWRMATIDVMVLGALSQNMLTRSGTCATARRRPPASTAARGIPHAEAQARGLQALQERGMAIGLPKALTV